MSRKKTRLSREKKKKKLLQSYASTGKNTVNYICLHCGAHEKIPKDVVEMMDGFDIDHDPFNPPQFSCVSCQGEMYPEYYKNELGYEFRISDVR